MVCCRSWSSSFTDSLLNIYFVVVGQNFPNANNVGIHAAHTTHYKQTTPCSHVLYVVFFTCYVLISTTT